MKRQNFVMIMSAGRCASTSLLNFLNRSNDFNIYGENCGFILNLTTCIKKISELIHNHRNIKYDNYLKYKNYQHYLTNAFFYDNEANLKKIRNNLVEQLRIFFPSNKSFIGFKEIRWLDYDIDSLNILDSMYNNIYIHLTRNINEQSCSLKKTFLNYKSIKDIEYYINQTNDRISNFLEKKNKKILMNISDNDNFLHDIQKFILNESGHDWSEFFA